MVSPHPVRLVWLALPLFVGLVLFGARWHWVEEAGTAERDGFVRQAELLAEGELPRDPFRPLLYPLATAGTARLLSLEPFTAARLISNLSAATLVILAFGFGLRLSGPWPATAALLLTAVNPNIWILGQHVTTDALFAALGAVVWWLGLRYLERGAGEKRLLLVALGLALGLAYFTRTTAVFLIPGLLFAWWWAPPAGARRRGLDLAVLGLSVTLVLLPHWWLRWRVFGNPLHDENWKNLAFKLYGFPDWSYLERVPFSGLFDVVREDPTRVLSGFGGELARFLFGGGAAQLLGTWIHLLLFALGAALLLALRRRRVLYLLTCMGFFLASVALVFFAWGRLLLALLPLANALLAAGLWEGGLRAKGAGLDRGRLAAALLLLGAIALLALKTFAFRLPAFVERHPYEEVATLKRLEAKLSAGEALAGTSPFLGRYLKRPYLYVGDAAGQELTEPKLYFPRLRAYLSEGEAAYLVVGELDLRNRPASLLATDPPVPWLRSEGCSDGVCVWRVLRSASESAP